MTTFHTKLTLRRYPWWVRAVQWLRNPRGYWPAATSRPWLDDWFAWLVPYAFRNVHRRYAAAHGYFWLPCPLCDKPSGGHEWRKVAGRPDSIPDPLDPRRQLWVGICPRCTRAGRGISSTPRIQRDEEGRDIGA